MQCHGLGAESKFFLRGTLELRNLFAIWPCMFTMSMGLMAVIPMLPLYIEERFGLTDPQAVRTWTGIIYGAAPLTAALFGPIWGALGDRVGRKPMVLRAAFAVAVAMALMPLAPTPGWLAGLRVLQGGLRRSFPKS